VNFYDLSKPLSERSLRSPGLPKVRFVDATDHIRDGFLSQTIEASLHTGTHIDAPAHFPGGSMDEIHQIPLDRLCGPGVILDMARDDYGVVTAEDLEAARPQIREGDRVVLNFGWHRLDARGSGGDPERFMFRFPGLDKSAVDWCVAKRLSWLGSDTPTPDHVYNMSTTLNRFRPDQMTSSQVAAIDRRQFPIRYCHHTLLAAGIPMIEQLGGEIDKVTGRRVLLFAVPISIVAEASPVRVVVVEGE
jgi:kynurenine formamidase